MMTHDLWTEFQMKVDFLKKLSSSDVETHMSWVFIINHYAYKIKKPNIFPHLRLDTLWARYENSLKEYAINQKLAPGYYLGIVPLVRDNAHQLRLSDPNPKGEIIDWLVKMRQIESDLTLDYFIKNDKDPGGRLFESAKKLALFYLNAKPANISGGTYHSRLRQYIGENFEALSQVRYGLDQNLVTNIHEAQIAYLEVERKSFENRVTMGKIIEGHGDLKPEHICLTDPPIIIDRLEFSEELRTLDPLDELNYLLMECTMLRRSELGQVFLKTYLEMSQDSIPPAMAQFFISFRSCIRAKIAVWHMDDPRIKQKEKWKIKAQKYLNSAKASLEWFPGNAQVAPPMNHLPESVSWHGQKEA